MTPQARMMTPRGLLTALVLLVLAGCAGVPRRQEVTASGACRPPLAAVVPLIARHHQLVVAARIAGRPVRLELDTGAVRTLLTDVAARRLGLEPDYSRAVRLTGVGGSSAGLVSTPVPLALGAARLAHHGVEFGLSARVFGPPSRWPGGIPDGILGFDFLAHFMVDLNIPRRRMTLYRPQPCPGAVPSWCHPCLVVPLQPAADPLLHVAVRLDGTRLDGVLDTGTMITVTTAATIRRAGIATPGLAHDPSLTGLGATGHRAAGRLHRFRALTLVPGLDLSPSVVILATTLPTVDLLVGLNALARQRIWIAPGAGRLAFAPPPPRPSPGR